jgi:hypothetical protein
VPVYFSPALDTLKIKSLQFLRDLPNLDPGPIEQLKLMKRLALWAGDWFWPPMLDLWPYFPKVEELTVVDDIEHGGAGKKKSAQKG